MLFAFALSGCFMLYSRGLFVPLGGASFPSPLGDSLFRYALAGWERSTCLIIYQV